MVEDMQRDVPLIGAFLVTEGMVTMEQLEECLLIQQRYHPTRQIGQILIRYGYVSEADLDYVLSLQREFRESMLHALEICMTSRREVIVGVRCDQDALD